MEPGSTQLPLTEHETRLARLGGKRVQGWIVDTGI